MCAEPRGAHVHALPVPAAPPGPEKTRAPTAALAALPPGGRREGWSVASEGSPGCPVTDRSLAGSLTRSPLLAQSIHCVRMVPGTVLSAGDKKKRKKSS